MFESLHDRYGDGTILLIAGALVGIIFGSAAQHSRFCLRSATTEVADGVPGPRLAIWLVAFTAAVFSVQTSIAVGWLDVTEARQLASTGSLSGALIGGALFGVGMILARGCASRLLVLSATGNLRALMAGLVLTLVAQAALRGVLTPARSALAGLWTVPGGEARNLLAAFGIGPGTAALVAAVALLLSIGFAVKASHAPSRWIAALVVGFAIGLGWLLTYLVSQISFEVVPIASVTFTGPSTDTLMGLVNAPDLPASFGVGLVPGVFIGSGIAALISGEFRIERFGPDAPMERYLIGACFMGFGAMLAGGCAVGAGMSGGAVFSMTAWCAVFAMWLGAMATHWMIGDPRTQTAAGTT